MTEWLSLRWDIVSAVAALAVLLLLLAGLINKLWRDRKLRNPVEAHFLIPDMKRYELGYVEQDGKEHLVDKVVVPSNATVPILIWWKPRLNFHEDELYFGCEGELEKKPRPVRYFNPFIIEGPMKETSPKENPDHYREWHYYYHIKTGKDRTKNEVYVGGFKLETKAEKKYKTHLFFHTPKRVGMAPLTIKVEDKPSTKMYCVQHKHYLKPKSLRKRMRRPK